jgi:hypothetical protein
MNSPRGHGSLVVNNQGVETPGVENTKESYMNKNNSTKILKHSKSFLKVKLFD